LPNEVVFTWVFDCNGSGDKMWFSTVYEKTDDSGGEYND